MYRMPQNNLKLCIKTEHITVGADATVYVWFLCQIYLNESQTYTVAVISSVFIRRLGLCFCIAWNVILFPIWENLNPNPFSSYFFFSTLQFGSSCSPKYTFLKRQCNVPFLVYELLKL